MEQYAGWNYAAHDLANTWCELAIDNLAPAYPFFSFHVELYPTDEEKRLFSRHFLIGRFGKEPTAEEIEKCVRQGQISSSCLWLQLV